MAKKASKRDQTRNRTNPNRFTPSQQRANANSAVNGRGGRISPYTGGATSVDSKNDTAEAMRRLWESGQQNATYTSTRGGRLSANGLNTKDAKTWTYTPKNDDGSAVINPKTGRARQSGRSEVSTRRQRDYDTRKGMNNITQKAMDAMIRAGLVRVVDGNMVGEGGNVIRQKADGNYSMGLATG